MSLRSACPLDKKSQTCASSFRKWGLSKSYSTPNLKTYPGCVGRGQLCSPSSHRAAQGRDPALGTSTGFFLKRAGTAWETLGKASQDSRVEACCVHGALSSYKYSRCFKKNNNRNRLNSLRSSQQQLGNAVWQTQAGEPKFFPESATSNGNDALTTLLIQRNGIDKTR